MANAVSWRCQGFEKNEQARKPISRLREEILFMECFESTKTNFCLHRLLFSPTSSTVYPVYTLASPAHLERSYSNNDRPILAKFPMTPFRTTYKVS